MQLGEKCRANAALVSNVWNGIVLYFMIARMLGENQLNYLEFICMDTGNWAWGNEMKNKLCGRRKEKMLQAIQ